MIKTSHVPRRRGATLAFAQARRLRVRAEPAWKVELAQLNEAIRESSDEDETSQQPVSLNLDDRERVFLVGVQVKARGSAAATFSAHESLQELARLASTAGLNVVGELSQGLDAQDPRTYIGSGKLAELAASVRALGAETVICDDELSPRQQRSLEKALGGAVRVADRTALILDIFDQRAATREGKLQVQLAAAEYQLPRLKRMWTHLERQSGAGMTRGGMGEKQMEIDKRLLRDQAAALRKEIDTVRRHRDAYRQRRRANNVPVVALVGYTNAGKSTLLNRLTGADVLAEDSLFATLDPTTRRVALPNGKVVLVSDTVGFIQKLPTQLVAAFRATLEEINEADVILHVVDVSHRHAAKQSETVFRILDEIAVSEAIPMVTAWNKIDAARNPDAVRAIADRRAGTVALSAQTGTGVDDLVVTIEAALEEGMVPFEAVFPFSQGTLVNLVRERGVVRKEHYAPDGVHISASANLDVIGRVSEHVTSMVPGDRVFEWRREQVLGELDAAGTDGQHVAALKA